MRLSELLAYEDIVIQCHDNPDADALASAYGVYYYLKKNGKNPRIVYGGRYRIQKSNLILMIDELNIPIEHVEELDEPELLLTVDCQYGQGNVTRFEAKNVAVIDHHQIGGELPAMNEVRSNLGACSTVVREMMEKEGLDVNEDSKLATALYYGLLTDTNNFAEISHPLDKDLRDDAKYERSLINRFRNSNLSLEELQIAGSALINYHYDENYHFAVVVAAPCDPNILGMISDLVLEVDSVETCLVYNIVPSGIKLSVRSCVKEVKASELAGFITKGIGNGGGHLEKAGGFIQMELIKKVFPDRYKSREEVSEEEFTQNIADFLNWRMIDYFDDIEIIHTRDYVADVSDMSAYRKKKIIQGYVDMEDERVRKVLPKGTKICVRTLEGDMDLEIDDELFIMIGVKGEVYPITQKKFEYSYDAMDIPYVFEGEYEPAVKYNANGRNVSLVPYAKACRVSNEAVIYAKQLDHRVKIFTEWDKEKYMLGEDEDFLAVRSDDYSDAYIIDRDIFYKTYEEII